MNSIVVNFVVIFCVVAAAASLGLAIFFGIQDWRAAAKVRDLAKTAAESISGETQNPLRPQAAGLSFDWIAKLAEALDKVNPSGRFLVASIAFTAAATIVVTVGTATG